MKNGRGVRLGKYIARAIKQLADPDFQDAVRNPVYMRQFKKFLNPNFETRKKGQPKTKGYESELEKIPYEKFNICLPKHFAVLWREYCHIGYNASTANRVKKSILDDLTLP